MDSTSEYVLNYENFWGERKNLKTPEMVGIFWGPKKNMDSIPFSLDIDTKGLNEFINDEGVIDGLPTYITYEFDKGNPFELSKFSDESLSPTELKKEFIAWIRETKYKTLLGYAIHIPGKVNRAVINVNTIYYYSLLTSFRSEEQFHNKFTKTLAAATAHEVEHLRQSPEQFPNGFHLDKIAKTLTGSLVLIDGTRRFFFPWLGTLEPAALQLESVLAAGATEGLYKMSTKERESMAAQRVNGPVLEKFIHTSIRDSSQFKSHYFWGILGELKDDIVSMAKKRKN